MGSRPAHRHASRDCAACEGSRVAELRSHRRETARRAEIAAAASVARGDIDLQLLKFLKADPVAARRWPSARPAMKVVPPVIDLRDRAEVSR